MDEYCRSECVRLLQIPRDLFGENAACAAAAWDSLPEEIARHFDKTVIFPGDRGIPDLRERARQISDLIELEKPDLVILPASQAGRQIGPMIAARLGIGIVADVVGVSRIDDCIRMTRPAFDGKLMAAIESVGEGPVLMTARMSAFSYGEKAAAECAASQPVRNSKTAAAFADQRIRIVREQEKEADMIDRAELLISVGGGFRGTPADAAALAESLGGMVSSSRKPVDEGLAPRSIQVGQSGKMVSPAIYLALGIRGAFQHMMGLENVGHIISVNSNRDAPMSLFSEISIICDARMFADKLLEKIERRQHDKR